MLVKVRPNCKNYKRAMDNNYNKAFKYASDSFWYDYHLTLADKYAKLYVDNKRKLEVDKLKEGVII